MRRHALLLLAVAAIAAAPQPPETPPSRRVILLSFDGAADWIVDRLVDTGKAPAFAALAREGARADAMISVLPTLTAPAHATLWTGAYPRVHGATDNTMPRTPASAHTLLERQSGFLSGVLKAEPIWITAAREGRRVLVAQATGGYPFSHAFPDRLVQFDAYGQRLLRSEIIEAVPGREGFAFRVGDSEGLVRLTDGRVELTIGGGTVELTGTRPFSPPIAVQVKGARGLVRIGLLDVDDLRGRVRLLRGEARIIAATHPDLLEPLVAESGVLIGEAAATPYQHGAFGPTLAEGGDGGAERTLAAAILANQEYFDGAVRFAAGRDWDLFVLYVSSLDTAGHMLVGMLDPDAPGHDAALAARVWPFYEDLFRRCADNYVAELRRRFPDATLVIGADHGMEGVRRIWYPNAVLRQAGLLAEDEDGRPDLSQTKALFLYSHGGGVFVNTDRYRLGIVPAPQRDEVKQAVVRALLSARDPANGAPLVRAIADTDVDGEALGIGGDVAPDLYFDPAPGYEAHAAFGAARLVVDGPPAGEGAHGPFPTRRALHGIFYAAGPGVAAGARPGLVRAIDVASTVARLLGIPPPPQSAGHPIRLDGE